MRFVVVLFVTVLVSASVACVGPDRVVGPGESCSHEGWWGPRDVCPAGYSCNDMESWTCTKNNWGASSDPTSTAPTSFPPHDAGPPPKDGGASDSADAADAALEEDAEADAMIDEDAAASGR